jgi:tetratricopeptide (TPR) repeat protein
MKLGSWIGVGCLAIGCATVGAEAAAQMCPNPREIPGAAAPAAELEHAPDRLDSRLALAAVLMERGCYAEVVAVVEAGQAFHPRAGELQLLLRDARSNLAEQAYFDGLEEAEAAAKVRRNLLRCLQLADVAACDAALEARPDDSQILAAKGDALAAGGKLGDALAAYGRVLEIAPDNTVAVAGVEAVEKKRADALAACFATAGGADALSGCELALIPGAPDEFDIQQRRGLLFQRTGDNARALDAYLAAADLRRDDRATAAAVVALADSTGRSDYVTLVARGAALTTLDRPADAIRVLRRARSLAPDLEAAPPLLAAAEARRRAAAADCRRFSAEQALTACRGALLQGASDELDLLVRTSTLLREAGDVAGARPLLERAAQLEPGDAVVAAELARLRADGERMAQADATAQPSGPAAGAVNGARRYSNSEPPGRAH